MISLAALSSVQSGVAQDQNGDLEALMMRQQSATYGTVTCFVTSDAFRMDAMGMQIFFKPPYKTIRLYNPQGKTVFAPTIQAFDSRVKWHQVSEDDKKKGMVEKILPKEKVDILGYKCQHYIAVHEITGKKAPATTVGEFWVTNDFKVPRPMQDACASLTDCPRGFGLPLRLLQYKNQSVGAKKMMLPHNLLSTSRIEKRKFSRTLMDEPRGYRQVRDEIELMLE